MSDKAQPSEQPLENQNNEENLSNPNQEGSGSQNAHRGQDAASRLGTEPVGKLLLRFSLPAITGMIVNALYNVVDRIFVGHGVGELALGGIALIMPVMTIFMAFAMLFGVGAANMISMRLGQGKREEAGNALNHCFFMLIFLGLLMFVVGTIFMEPILSMLGAQEGSQALEYGRSYLRIILMGTVFSMIGFGLSHCTRAQGFPAVTMTGMILGAVLNIILDAIFIMGFNWGVEGAAYATIISQAVSAAFFIRFIFSKKAVVKLRPAKIKPSKAIIFQIMSFGSAQFLLQFIMSGVQLLNNVSMGWYGAAALGVANGGDIALSGWSIIGSIAMFFFMPIFGINQGAQPILGFNYGAKNFHRVRSTYKRAVSVASLIGLTGFLVTMIFPYQLIGIFTHDTSAALMDFTPRAMRIMFLMMPLNGFQIISANLFVVTGRPKITIFLSMLRQFLVLIPCILIFGRFWGLWGVITAAPVADSFAFLITATMMYFELRKLNRQANPAS